MKELRETTLTGIEALDAMRHFLERNYPKGFDVLDVLSELDNMATDKGGLDIAVLSNWANAVKAAKKA